MVEPFGPKSQWLAVRSSRAEAVVELLRLRNVVRVPWRQGVDAAYGDEMKVFVTPPIDGWVLALDGSFAAFEGGDLVESPNTLARWSQQLGAPVQHWFCDRRSGTYGWIRAEEGRLMRAFLEVEGQVRTSVGSETQDERRLRTEVAGHPATDGTTLAPGEDLVFRLASRWSIDPHVLDRRSDLPAFGWSGDSPE